MCSYMSLSSVCQYKNNLIHRESFKLQKKITSYWNAQSKLSPCKTSVCTFFLDSTIIKHMFMCVSATSRSAFVCRIESGPIGCRGGLDLFFVCCGGWRTASAWLKLSCQSNKGERRGVQGLRGGLKRRWRNKERKGKIRKERGSKGERKEEMKIKKMKKKGRKKKQRKDCRENQNAKKRRKHVKKR